METLPGCDIRRANLPGRQLSFPAKSENWLPVPLSDPPGDSMKAPKVKPSPRLRVTDLNLRKAAQRLLGQSLVSTEMQYV